MAELSIETRTANNIPIIDLRGEVDSYNSPTLRERMIGLIEAGNANLILNMRGVDYIDSTGLGTLVVGLKRATERGGGIRIICSNEQILKVFSMTGLVKVFSIFDDEDAALSA
jgi:anti-anti-sigma factor